MYICVCKKRIQREEETRKKKKRGRRILLARSYQESAHTYTHADDLSIDATRTDIERDSWLPRTMEIIRPCFVPGMAINWGNLSEREHRWINASSSFSSRRERFESRLCPPFLIPFLIVSHSPHPRKVGEIKRSQFQLFSTQRRLDYSSPIFFFHTMKLRYIRMYDQLTGGNYASFKGKLNLIIEEVRLVEYGDESAISVASIYFSWIWLLMRRDLKLFFELFWTFHKNISYKSLCEIAVRY